MTNRTEDDVLALVEYLASPEGQARVADVVQQCAKFNDDLDARLRVDPQDLKQRFTL